MVGLVIFQQSFTSICFHFISLFLFLLNWRAVIISVFFLYFFTLVFMGNQLVFHCNEILLRLRLVWLFSNLRLMLVKLEEQIWFLVFQILFHFLLFFKDKFYFIYSYYDIQMIYFKYYQFILSAVKS